MKLMKGLTTRKKGKDQVTEIVADLDIVMPVILDFFGFSTEKVTKQTRTLAARLIRRYYKDTYDIEHYTYNGSKFWNTKSLPNGFVIKLEDFWTENQDAIKLLFEGESK